MKLPFLTEVLSNVMPRPNVALLQMITKGDWNGAGAHTNFSELQAPAKISTYTIGPFQSTKGERDKVRVKVRLNLPGVVSIESATLLEEEELEIPVVKESTKMDTDEAPSAAAPSSTTENDVNMEDAKSAADAPAFAVKKKEKRKEMNFL